MLAFNRPARVRAHAVASPRVFERAHLNRVLALPPACQWMAPDARFWRADARFWRARTNGRDVAGKSTCVYFCPHQVLLPTHIPTCWYQRWYNFTHPSTRDSEDAGSPPCPAMPHRLTTTDAPVPPCPQLISSLAPAPNSSCPSSPCPSSPCPRRSRRPRRPPPRRARSTA